MIPLKIFALMLLLTQSSCSKSANQEELKKTLLEFGNIVVEILGLAPGSVPIAVGAAQVLTSLINTASGTPDGDLWTQIEARVLNKIGKSLTGYHLSDIKSDFRLFTIKLAKGSNFDTDDLDYIMAKKLRMMPQNYPDLGFTTQLVTILPAWTGYMVAGQLQLIKQGVKSKCDLASQLTQLRDETIQAAKSLIRKRYKGITGTGFYRGSRDGGCSQGGIPCRSMARFKLEDEATGKTHDTVMGRVNSRVYSELQRETEDIIWNSLVTPINKFFQHKICMSGCSCPSLIDRAEIAFDLPHACYGDGKFKKDQRCTIPCHAYGSTYTWCPYYPSGRVPINNLLFNHHWQECTPADYSSCMPVKQSVMFNNQY